jgi:hypothetical protein
MIKKLTLTAIAFVGFCTIAFAQDPGSASAQTRLGKYTGEKTVENMVGDPYLFADWKPATVKFASGKVFKDMQVKYNLVDDKLRLKGETGEPMNFVDQVAEFRISSTNGELQYRNGFNPVGNYTAYTFYEIIFEGKIKLLKKVSKTIIETQDYNSPSMVKNIDEQTHYFLVKNDQLTEFKPVKKAVVELLKDKQDLINSYISSSKVDFKSDDSLKALFYYYNSLQ